MITAKKIDTKKLAIYVVVLLVVALITLVVVLSDSINLNLTGKVSDLLKRDNNSKVQTPSNPSTINASVLESAKFQSLSGVVVLPINPVVGQKNPFNETEKK